MQNSSSQVTLFLSIVALVSGLVYPPLSAYTAVYVTLGALIIGLLLHWRDLQHLILTPPYMLVLSAFVLYVITEPFRWHGVDGLLILAVFLPVIISIGLAALLREQPLLASPLMLGRLCLVGSLGGLLVALNDGFILGISRAGGGNNPIHFADLVVTLGLMALIGVFGSKSIWRFIFFAGPLMATFAVLLSGTRGAIMTMLLVAVMLAIVFTIWQRSAKPVLLAAVAIAIIIAGGLAIRPDTITRAQNGLQQSFAATQALLFDQENGKVPVGVDNSTDYRISMIRSAFHAFLDAPLFGHGAGQIIPATRPYYPERNIGIDAHLHSDLADFAVAGGLVGLLSYLALLAAPFMALLMTKNRQFRRVLVVGAIVLSGTFFGNGMTNAVFGVLPQSALFGVLLAFLVAFARQTNENQT